MGRALDSMMTRLKAIHFSWLGPELLSVASPTGVQLVFSFAPELVRYSAHWDFHRRAAYSVCGSWFLVRRDVCHDLYVCS